MEKKINPWLSIWFSPRKTVRYLLDTNPKRAFFKLCFISSLSFFVYKEGFFLSLVFLKKPLFPIYLALSLLIFFAVGILFILFETTLTYLSGRILKGKASWIELRSVVSWSRLPLIVYIFLPFFFFPAMVRDSWGFLAVLGALLTFFSWIECAVIWIVGVSEAQHFSKKRAFASLFLNLAFYFLFITVFLGLIMLVSSLLNGRGF